MGTLARLLIGPPATKAAGVPSISDDGTFITAPSFSWLGLGGRSTSGVTVSTETALGLVSVYACIRVLAESVASLPLILYRRLPGGGKERATDHPMYALLHDQPNPEMTSFVWRETVMAHLVTWGNSYNEIAFDSEGRLQLWPLPPSRVEVSWENDRRVYDFLQPNGQKRRLADRTIFHIPGLSSNGLVGYSPIALHREAIGLYQALQDFGSATMRNMARPAVFMKHPKTLSAGAIERLTAQMDRLRGTANAGKTILGEEGLDIKEIGIPPEDAQYIESRKFQRTEIAAMFRVPPHKIGDLERATFSNIEHQALEFVTDSLRPWLVRIEQEIKARLLFGEDVFAEFLVDGLLRGDAKSRAQALAIRWQHGTLSPDEWREIENENPLPDGIGARTYTPVNYEVAAPEEDEEEEGPAPLVRIKSAGEVRCTSCHRLLAEQATPPYRIACSRCKAVTADGDVARKAQVIEYDDRNRIVRVVEDVV